MKICFIGGGNMAAALIGGLLKRSFVAEQLCVVETNKSRHATLHSEFGVRAVAELQAGVIESDIILLAVKPQQLHEVATSLAPLLTGQLLISIAAGVRTTDIASWLGSQNIVRAVARRPKARSTLCCAWPASPCDVLQTANRWTLSH